MNPCLELQQFPETQKTTSCTYESEISSPNTQANVAEVLDSMFPEQKRQDRDVAKAKEILGDLVKELTNTQIKEMVTDCDFLVTTWLDDFERSLFDGLTLREVLHEGEHK